MRMLRKLSLFASFTLATAMPLTSANATPVIDKKGIKVWVYPSTQSAAFNYKASRLLQSNLQGAVSMIMDTPSLKRWVPYTKKVQVIEQDNTKGTFVLYMVLNFPFPLDNRDVVVKGGWQQQADKSVKIWSYAINDPRVPVNPSMVRIVKYEGSWVIRPVNATTVEVTTTGFAEPGGSIPLSLANRFVKNQPYEMLSNMTAEIGRYQTQKVALVTEPTY